MNYFLHNMKINETLNPLKFLKKKEIEVRLHMGPQKKARRPLCQMSVVQVQLPSMLCMPVESVAY